MSLFERFKETKEEGFRNEFIKPLLVRLGFFEICDLHGAHEFGKDFAFSEQNRFGLIRHMGLQAKHEKAISQGPPIDGLLSQVRQAFNKPYTIPSAPNEERAISSVGSG